MLFSRPGGGIGRWGPALRLARVAAVSLALTWAAAPAGAQDPAPDVSLDDLLKLPSGVSSQPAEEKAGATRDEWQHRFQAARGSLEQAKAALAHALAELDQKSSSGSWKMAPPGLGQLMQQQQNQHTGGQAATGEADPVPQNYGLSGEVRRQKEEVKRAERALRDLEVQANLAGVPDGWRH